MLLKANLMSAGSVPAEMFLGSAASSGSVTWNYDAKIVLATIINNSYNHVIIFDLSSSNYRHWVTRNNLNSNNWILNTTPATDGFPYTCTSKSITMTIPSGSTCNMIIPLDADFPESI